MPIPFNSKLQSEVANNTFVDKTQDDATVGKLALENTASESGVSIANPQREINKNSKSVSTVIPVSGGDQLTPSDLSMIQIFKIIGNAAPVNLDPVAFDATPLDGTEIVLIGQDDTNTVTITLNDVQFGQYINDDATLKRGYILRLIYDADAERYFEIGRNF